MTLVLFLAGTAWGGMTKDEAFSSFIKANLVYKDGKYDEAIKIYDDIIRSGWASGSVYYNLGNSCVKKSQWGRAILNYERARLLIPRDGDLQSNYAYALSQTRVPSSDDNSLFVREYNKFLRYYTLNEFILAFSILGFLLLGVQLCAVYLSWPPISTRRILLAMGVFSCLIFVSAVIKFNSVHEYSIVVAEGAAKFEPRIEATTYFDLYPGEKVRATKQDGPWVKVKRSDGRSGWIRIENVEDIYTSQSAHQSITKAGSP